MVKRAITLGGGGPAAGLHIGVLEALAAHNIEFDVWALSCIGAWVGIVYNQFDNKIKNQDRVERTHQFFKNGVFRDDRTYERFPINRVFGPDWKSIQTALIQYVTDPKNYLEWNPYRMMDLVQESMKLGSKSNNSTEGDINGWFFNQVMAPNPFVRYVTSMIYLSNLTGLSKIYYPDCQFLKEINFDELKRKGKPAIFHNAWNFHTKKLALFSNREMKKESEKYKYEGPISAATLCACSALPYIEETVDIGPTTYCEGALVDTVSFDSLIEEHHNPPNDKLDEIWVCRIVDSAQVRKPKNLHDALANLCELFAASVGEDDVKLFKYHVQYDNRECDVAHRGEEGGSSKLWNGTLVEIQVPGHINFKWNHSNLENGRKLGAAAATQAFEAYDERKDDPHPESPLFINQKSEHPAKRQKLREYHEELKRTAR